ncbi:MAG TPA: DUF3467 domain-containing protein [Miltoncostaeaceae bacterium]|nr:DUF3467 domain-containing protein [Miltoncostaeaceae bacterium]
MSDDRPPRIYANAVNARGGPFEVSLTMGFRSGPDEPVEDLAEVIMSWEHARVLHDVFSRLISDYESKVGPIPRVEEVIEEAG